MQLMLQLARVCACGCVCVYQFTASLHTVQENQNGSHENQHPAATAAAAKAAASGKCKVNFVEGHASSRSFPWPSVGSPTHSVHPPISTVVFVFTLLRVRVCATIMCALFGLTFHFALSLAFCGLAAAFHRIEYSIKETAYKIEFSINLMYS